MKTIPAGASFHVTERDGTCWLAMKFPKRGTQPGAANKRVADLGPDREFAEAVAREMNARTH